MRIAINAVGRLVLPKPLRAELGIEGPAGRAQPTYAAFGVEVVRLQS